MIKDENLSKWKGEAPSFEHFPKLMSGPQKGTQSRQFARYEVLNTDKIVGRQMTLNVTIIQLLEEIREKSKVREQGLIAQTGNLSNSHEELMGGIVQDLRREFEANKCRCGEAQINDEMTHSVRIDKNGYGLFDLDPPTLV